MKIEALAATVAVILCASPGWAQSPQTHGGRMERGQPPGGPGLGRALEEFFFPAELVMRNQRALGLKDDQQAAIRADMQKTVARFTDLQWQQSAAAETLESLFRQQSVDEKGALAEFDKLLAIESEIKRLHLASLIKVKNLLTPEQQATLRGLNQPPRLRQEGPPQRFGDSPQPGGRPPGGRPQR